MTGAANGIGLAVARRLVAAHGRVALLDIVVANAAIEPVDQDRRVHQLELEVWRRVMDVNLTGRV